MVKSAALFTLKVAEDLKEGESAKDCFPSVHWAIRRPDSRVVLIDLTQNMLDWSQRQCL